MAERRLPAVLIAEDDPDAREWIEAAARRSAAFSAIQMVEDGQAVLNTVWHTILAEEHHALPDVILSDLNMPGLDGIEVAHDLKSHTDTRGIPLAILTGSAGPGDRERAAAAGCEAFYEKPKSLEALTDIMRAVATLAVPPKRLIGSA